MFGNNTKMRQKSKIFLQISFIIVLFIIFDGFHTVSTQKASERTQMPIGAYRIFPKTTFSCLGRPAGYYADIETGCQVYHMCDGLGRQFSYSCPNTTLFQQRMLICDHWYMVNCSKSESDYAANLLIGQRDKPFVPEEENQLRTPRPDLLDRPYAPDYSGESYRNQYKDHRQISNEINDSDGTEKQYFHQVNPPSATRWHLPRPSSEVQPPSTNFIRRNDVVEENIAVDLGTSHSSNYNTSGDFSAEVPNSVVPKQSSTVRPVTTIITTTTNSPISTTTPYIKPPSRLYEPPFLYPIYNLNYTEPENEEDTYQETSTVLTTSKILTKATTIVPVPTTTSTTQRPFTRPAIFSGKPFAPVALTSLAPTVPLTTTTENYENFSDSFTKSKVDNFISRTQINTTTSQPRAFETQTQTPFRTSTNSEGPVDVSTPFLDLLPPIFNHTTHQPEPFKPNPTSNNLPPVPSQTLLPPLQEFVVHDVATTQGPPIYFEWKIPSDGLEPPKLDPPPGTEEENQNQSNDDIVSASSLTVTESSTTKSPFANNPFLAPILNNRDQQLIQSSIRTPTVRSIPKTTTTLKPPHSLIKKHDIDNESIANGKNENVADVHKEVNIQQLQKDFLIPDFLFPLDNDARTGYEQGELFNSFQLKIPERRNNEKPWYGENPDCPECHPSFVKPGTCEPCVKRR